MMQVQKQRPTHLISLFYDSINERKDFSVKITAIKHDGLYNHVFCLYEIELNGNFITTLLMSDIKAGTLTSLLNGIIATIRASEQL